MAGEKTFTVLRTEGDNIVFEKKGGGTYSVRLAQGYEKPPVGRVVGEIHSDVKPWTFTWSSVFEGGGGNSNYQPPSAVPSREDYANIPQGRRDQAKVEISEAYEVQHDSKQRLIAYLAVYKTLRPLPKCEHMTGDEIANLVWYEAELLMAKAEERSE